MAARLLIQILWSLIEVFLLAVLLGAYTVATLLGIIKTCLLVVVIL
jgi:hypothetical protein